MASPRPDPAELLSGEVRYVRALARALLRDADLADDVAQDALLAKLQHRGEVSHWRGWLAEVTRRLAATARRRQRERTQREAAAARAEAGDGGDATAARLRLYQRLCAAVLSLPEPYRTAVTLRYLDGLPPRAIAQRLRRPVDAVRQHVHRGLSMLRQRLDGEFGDRSSWTAAFAACGLGGGAAATSILVPVLIMKKTLAAAVLVAAFGAWWLLADGKAAASEGASGGPVAVQATGAGAGGAQGAAHAASNARADAAAARTELTFAVVVVDEAGVPQPDLTVHCWRRVGAATKQRTDANGIAAFAPADGAGALAIEVPARPLLLLPLPRLVGQERVVLARGAEIRGQVLVDGAPAPAGLRLTFTGDRELPAGLPPAAAQWAAEHGSCITGTDAVGNFHVAGLADGWSGQLAVPPDHWIVDSAAARDDAREWSRMQVRAPASLRVATTRLQSVRGRVVWKDDHAPVPAAGLDCYGCFAGFDDHTGVFGVRAAADGTFVAVFVAPGHRLRWLDPPTRPRLEQVRIGAEARGSRSSVQVTLDAEWLRQPRELVIELPRAAPTHFVARDEVGAPIAGAVVQLREAGECSEPTGADGSGSFCGTPVVIGAPGRLVVPFPAQTAGTGTVADPLQVVLAPDNRLRIRLRTPAGDVPECRSVLLRAALDFFAGGRRQLQLDRRFGSGEADCVRMGHNRADGTIEWYESTARLEVDEHGEVELHSLAAGVHCAVMAIDGLGEVLAAQEIALPSAGEAAIVELRIEAQPRRLRGRVLDADSGAPLQDAKIRLAAGSKGVWAYSAADGSFASRDVYSRQALAMVVSASGHASQGVEGLDAGSETTPLEIRLQRGRKVHVRVRDAEGAIVPVHVALAGKLGDGKYPQALAAGDYVYEDLPPGLVTFFVQLGSQRFELQHDTALAEAELRVPTPAGIAITAPSGWPAPAYGIRRTVRATRLDAAAEPCWLRLDDGRGRAQLLLPGRYRFELFDERGQDRHLERTPAGAAAEAVLTAGQAAAVELQATGR